MLHYQKQYQRSVLIKKEKYIKNNINSCSVFNTMSIRYV